MHAVEVTFERIHPGGPELAKGSQPRVYLLKWFRFQSVETPLCVHGGFDEASLAQHSQMLGYGRL